MRCTKCGSAAVTERPERSAQGYRRFRCRQCGKQFNERSSTLLNRAQYPSDVIPLVVLWRLRYKLVHVVPGAAYPRLRRLFRQHGRHRRDDARGGQGAWRSRQHRERASSRPMRTDLFLDGKTPEVLHYFEEQIALGQLGEPSDIADAVSFLVGPQGGRVNGQSFAANGGYW